MLELMWHSSSALFVLVLSPYSLMKISVVIQSHFTDGKVEAFRWPTLGCEDFPCDHRKLEPTQVCKVR